MQTDCIIRLIAKWPIVKYRFCAWVAIGERPDQLRAQRLSYQRIIPCRWIWGKAELSSHNLTFVSGIVRIRPRATAHDDTGARRNPGAEILVSALGIKSAIGIGTPRHTLALVLTHNPGELCLVWSRPAKSRLRRSTACLANPTVSPSDSRSRTGRPRRVRVPVTQSGAPGLGRAPVLMRTRCQTRGPVDRRPPHRRERASAAMIYRAARRRVRPGDRARAGSW